MYITSTGVIAQLSQRSVGTTHLIAQEKLDLSFDIKNSLVVTFHLSRSYLCRQHIFSFYVTPELIKPSVLQNKKVNCTLPDPFEVRECCPVPKRSCCLCHEGRVLWGQVLLDRAHLAGGACCSVECSSWKCVPRLTSFLLDFCSDHRVTSFRDLVHAQEEEDEEEEGQR